MPLPDNPPTDEELALVAALRERGVRVVTDKRFSYEKKTGGVGYIKPDVVIPDLKLVIEVDGSHHTGTTDQVYRDRLRDRTIRAHGYEVQHVSNYLILNRFELQGFADQIAGECVEKGVVQKASKTPIPSRKRPSAPPYSPPPLSVKESLDPPWVRPTPARKPRIRTRLVLVTSIIVIAAMVLFFSWPRTSPAPAPEPIGPFDKTAINTTVPGGMSTSKDITTFCTQRCGSADIYESDARFGASMIICHCKDDMRYFDSRTKDALSLEEVRNRNAFLNDYWSKYTGPDLYIQQMYDQLSTGMTAQDVWKLAFSNYRYVGTFRGVSAVTIARSSGNDDSVIKVMFDGNFTDFSSEKNGYIPTTAKLLRIERYYKGGLLQFKDARFIPID